MKKRKFICIDHPFLQRIRDNLRVIILSKVRQQEKEIYNKIREIEKSAYHKRGALTEAERKKVDDLGWQSYNLSEMLRRSIVICSICQTRGDHRILNPKVKEWVCPSCYALIRTLYYELKEHVDKGGNPGDFDLEYLASFLD